MVRKDSRLRGAGGEGAGKPFGVHPLRLRVTRDYLVFFFVA